MNAPVALKASIPSLQMNETELLAVLGSSLYPGAKVESMKLVIGYCKAAGLDPLQKPVHIVPMSVKISGTDKYEWRDVVMPGIELYRIKASRTGQHVGTSEPEFGPDKVLKVGDYEHTYPQWCKVSVWKMIDGQAREFVGKELWLENYATAGKDSKMPNAMWKRRSFGQLAKCAEAQALRKAFPELGAQPTAEEMEGKVIDVDHDPQQVAQIAGPTSKSAAAAVAEQSTGAAASGGEPAASGQAAESTGVNAQPMKPSQVNIIRAKLKGAALTDIDLFSAFPDRSFEPVEGKVQFTFGDFNTIAEWIAKSAKG